MPKKLDIYIQAVLIASYPLIAHLSILLGKPELHLISFCALLVGVLWQGLIKPNVKVWAWFVVICLSFFLLSRWRLDLYLLYVPPVLIPLVLLLYFGKTLLPNETPLITAIADAARGPLTPAMASYTRRLTQLWCGIFILLIVEALVLISFFNLTAWSWATNCINYLLMAIIFVGEFEFRKKKFPDHDHPTFLDYIKIIGQSFRNKV
ncbi:MAG: hypothetical protein IPK77_12400 [Cellvibrio sp.]|jgi:uncharacterized membrane protein|nr:hypothetical protein [Cellvibrio sp.]